MGIALMRNESMARVAALLGIALPTTTGKLVAPSALTQARQRGLGESPTGVRLRGDRRGMGSPERRCAPDGEGSPSTRWMEARCASPTLPRTGKPSEAKLAQGIAREAHTQRGLGWLR